MKMTSSCFKSTEKTLWNDNEKFPQVLKGQNMIKQSSQDFCLKISQDQDHKTQ